MQTELTIPPHLVQALSGRRREPAWLAERRLEAVQLFDETPLPRWDRTDLSAVDLAGLLRRALGGLDGAAGPGDGRLSDPGALQGLDVPPDLRTALEARRPGSAVLVNVARADGRSVSVAWVDPDLAARGVVVAPLSQALSVREDVVRAHLMARALPPSLGKFPALAGALWDVGSLVYVPRGLRLEAPVEVITWAEGGRPGVFPRTLVVLEEEARVRLLETWGSSRGAEPVLVAGGVEIVTGPHSRLDYASIQRWDTAVTAFVHRRAVLDHDSQVEWALGEFGAGLTRAEFETELQGRGASSHSVLVFFAGQDQHLDLLNVMNHHGTHTESDIVARGVLSGQARGIYRAVTHIRRGARQSGSWQKGNILVLSADARADANPTVVVEENDVLRAGHAATVGKVDPEQLFYLMSRGLPERVAIRLMVEGFLQPVLEKIPLEAARDLIRDLVAQRLEGA